MPTQAVQGCLECGKCTLHVIGVAGEKESSTPILAAYTWLWQTDPIPGAPKKLKEQDRVTKVTLERGGSVRNGRLVS